MVFLREQKTVFNWHLNAGLADFEVIMNDKTTLMAFPCDFNIKVIGNNSASFVNEITAIVQKHYPGRKDDAICSQPSKQGNYLALTITVHALDQASLDALYRDLTKHPDIKMVL